MEEEEQREMKRLDRRGSRSRRSRRRSMRIKNRSRRSQLIQADLSHVSTTASGNSSGPGDVKLSIRTKKPRPSRNLPSSRLIHASRRPRGHFRSASRRRASQRSSGTISRSKLAGIQEHPTRGQPSSPALVTPEGCKHEQRRLLGSISGSDSFQTPPVSSQSDSHLSVATTPLSLPSSSNNTPSRPVKNSGDALGIDELSASTAAATTRAAELSIPRSSKPGRLSFDHVSV